MRAIFIPIGMQIVNSSNGMPNGTNENPEPIVTQGLEPSRKA